MLTGHILLFIYTTTEWVGPVSLQANKEASISKHKVYLHMTKTRANKQISSKGDNKKGKNRKQIKMPTITRQE
jgi:hypothetical protein